MSFKANSFEVESYLREDVLILGAKGELDVYSAHDFKDPLMEAVSEKQRKIVIDLSKVTFIDSTGLGILVNAAKHLRSHNGKMVLVIKEDGIDQVFRITKLDQIFKIYQTQEEAIASL